MRTFIFDRRQMLKLGLGATALSLSGGCMVPQTAQRATLPLGRDQSFDRGWQFYRGTGAGFEAPTFDDSGWRKLDLPHDWSVEDAPGNSSAERIGPFDQSSPTANDSGFTIGGEGWYRKHFKLPELSAKGQVEIYFEGVSVVSDVWINGIHLGRRVHGYTPFGYDLTPHIRRAGENVIVVRVRNVGRNSRWYAGSGIYRPVTLNVLPDAARIARWGVAAWTRKIDGQRAEIDVTTSLSNATAGHTLVTRLLDQEDNVVVEARSVAGQEVKQTLHVPSPQLWSPDAPRLYQLESVLLRGDDIVDGTRQPFGIRIIKMDAQQGLQINGKRVTMRGGCFHHDNGLLGAAAYADAEARKVRLLKARGFNAIRSSHNPSSQALRDACDREGMLLIEESFDMWHASKLADDYSNYFAEHWRADIQAMVLSARNSACVFMWSIGNEIAQRSTPTGVEWSWKLANEVHRLDPTRPVTAALNGSPGRPLIAEAGTARHGQAGKADYASSIFLDVVGYNYKLIAFQQDHQIHPQRVFYGSETYPREAYDYWALAQKAPYMLGEFVWTAMDYLGEAGLGLSQRLPADNARLMQHKFPVVGAFCGDVDLIGEQKPQSLARDVIWGLSPIEMTVARPLRDNEVEMIPPWGWPEELPSWTWPGAEGRSLQVRVYSSGDKVELRLNGSKVADKALAAADKMFAEFSLTYAVGEIEAIAYRDGEEIGRRQLHTASAASALQLVPEQVRASADRQSLHYVRIDIVDAAGRLLPDEQRALQVHLEGPAELLGFGNANPRATGSLQADVAQAFQGRALLILRSTGTPGVVKVRAVSDGLSSGTTRIRLS